MDHHTTTTPDEALARAGDVSAHLDDPEIATALEALGRELATSRGATTGSPARVSTSGPLSRRPVRTPRSRRRAALVAGAALLAVAIPTTSAAADWVSLHTGWYGSEDGHGRQEYLRIDSPEGMSLLRQDETEYPLPPGGTYEALEARWRSNPDGISTATLWKVAVESEATCQWVGAWISADHDDDAPLQTEATTVLAGRASLPLVIRTSDSSGSAVTLMRRLGHAAATGDTATVRQYQDANCDGDPHVRAQTEG